MKSAAERLLDQCRAPVTVRGTRTALDAYHLMRQGDFSQLPVVDDDGVLVGLISSESLLRAVHDRGGELPATSVAAALVPPPPHFHAVPRLPELLNALLEQGVVLMINGEGRPERIVTTHDATEFFRVRSQELLWLEERNFVRRAQGHRFFLALQHRLEQESLPPLSVEESMDGRQITFLRARHGVITITLTFSFTVQRTSRIELHIDAPSPSDSKRFFDLLLLRREEIEAAAGKTLAWDRMEHARGCRVSVTTEAFLGTSELALKRLENWATEWVCSFVRSVWSRAVDLAHEPGTGLHVRPGQSLSGKRAP